MEEEKTLPTKEEFIMFEKIRQSGRFNMYDPQAQIYSGLNEKTYMEVLKNYSELNLKYPEVRNTNYWENI